jgi:hypothetical protein
MSKTFYIFRCTGVILISVLFLVLAYDLIYHGISCQETWKIGSDGSSSASPYSQNEESDCCPCIHHTNLNLSYFPEIHPFPSVSFIRIPSCEFPQLVDLSRIFRPPKA